MGALSKPHDMKNSLKASFILILLLEH